MKVIPIVILAVLLSSCAPAISPECPCASTADKSNTALAKKANDDVWRGTTNALKNQRIP